MLGQQRLLMLLPVSVRCLQCSEAVSQVLVKSGTLWRGSAPCPCCVRENCGVHWFFASTWKTIARTPFSLGYQKSAQTSTFSKNVEGCKGMAVPKTTWTRLHIYSSVHTIYDVLSLSPYAHHIWCASHTLPKHINLGVLCTLFLRCASTLNMVCLHSSHYYYIL